MMKKMVVEKNLVEGPGGLYYLLLLLGTYTQC